MVGDVAESLSPQGRLSTNTIGLQSELGSIAGSHLSNRIALTPVCCSILRNGNPNEIFRRTTGGIAGKHTWQVTIARMGGV